jgi:hypothetical protein
MLKSTIRAAAALSLFAASSAAAEVVARHADGFTLRFAVPMEQSAGDVVLALEDIGGWWDGAHTYSGDAANLSLSLEPDACFCEALPDGSMFEHGRLVALDDDHMALDAPLGPLKGRASKADLTFSWPGAAGGTMVTMTFAVEGTGMGAMADAVNGVMAVQFERFISYVEYGAPSAPAPSAA